MECIKCLCSMYGQMLSVGKCKVCGEPTPSPHVPSFVICDNCSQKHELCIQCGIRLKDGEETHPEGS